MREDSIRALHGIVWLYGMVCMQVLQCGHGIGNIVEKMLVVNRVVFFEQP